MTMDENYIRMKIDELRISQNLSERKLSQELGKNTSYINSISNGKYLPSWTEFLYICEYFKITPSQFFNQEQSDSLKMIQVNRLVKNLDDETLDILLLLLNKLQSEQ